jgi:hypothetical protein
MTARVAARRLRIDGDHVDRLLVEHRRAGRAGRADPRADRALRHRQPRQRRQQVGARSSHSAPSCRAPRPDGPQRGRKACSTPLRRTADGRRRPRPRRLDYRTTRPRSGSSSSPTRSARPPRRRPRPADRLHPRRRHRPHELRTAQPAAGAPRGRLPRLHHRRPRHLLVSADFASVELRVAAALSGDRPARSHARRRGTTTCTGRSPGSPSAPKPPRPTGTPSSAASSAGSTAAGVAGSPAASGSTDHVARHHRRARRDDAQLAPGRAWSATPCRPAAPSSRPTPAASSTSTQGPAAQGAQLLHPGHRPRAARRRPGPLVARPDGARPFCSRCTTSSWSWSPRPRPTRRPPRWSRHGDRAATASRSRPTTCPT